jgi:hypothetical protein
MMTKFLKTLYDTSYCAVAYSLYVLLIANS